MERGSLRFGIAVRYFLKSGAIYRTEIEDSLSLKAFGRSQTYRHEGQRLDPACSGHSVILWQRTVGQALLQQLMSVRQKQKHVEIKKDRRDKVQAKYHVLELQPECSKLVASRVKEVNMAARDSDVLERFKLRSGKVRLADDKTLDIAGVEDVLDEEGYHVGFGDQQWKVTKGSLVVARENKRGSLYMVEKAMALHLLHQYEDPATMILLSKAAAGFAVGYNANLQVKCLKFDNSGEYTTQMKCGTAFGIRRVTTLSEAEILYLWTRFMEPVQKSSPDEALRVRGPKTVGASSIVEDHIKKKTEDGASSKEGGSETPHLPRSKKSRIAAKRYEAPRSIVAARAFLCSDMAEFNKLKRLFPLVFEMKDALRSSLIMAKLVRVLISEGTLSFITRLVMKEKLSFAQLQLASEITDERSYVKWKLNIDRDKTRLQEPNEESGGSTKRSRVSEEGDYVVHSNQETPNSGGSTIQRPIGRDAAKKKGNGKASPNNEFVEELRAMRITRESEIRVMNKMLEIDKKREEREIKREEMKLKREERKLKKEESKTKKMYLLHLNALLAKNHLSPEEEDMKRNLYDMLYRK
ncbi:hypothetical protein Tco_0462399 [Tanacetum coccineum]